MAIRTDRRRGPLARKKLCAVAAQTSRMLGNIGDIGKGSVALAHLLPVFRWNFMTGVTGELLPDGVGGMRETGVINFRFGWGFGLARSRTLRSFLRRNS